MADSFSKMDYSGQRRYIESLQHVTVRLFLCLKFCFNFFCFFFQVHKSDTTSVGSYLHQEWIRKVREVAFDLNENMHTLNCAECLRPIID